LTQWATGISVDIADSAFKHGISREQILRALRMPYRIARIGEDRVLTIGSDETGRLIEIVTLDPQDAPLVIHAMPLRAKFHPYL
jgi:hypothetical protein